MSNSVESSKSNDQCELAKSAFREIGYQQLNSITCEMKGDELVLSGNLNSFYLKQVAQSVAVKIPGVGSVRNEIVVI